MFFSHSKPTSKCSNSDSGHTLKCHTEDHPAGNGYQKSAWPAALQFSTAKASALKAHDVTTPLLETERLYKLLVMSGLCKHNTILSPAHQSLRNCFAIFSAFKTQTNTALYIN